MGDTTRIEWTDATWSPVTGCTRVSPGCLNCYIERTPPFRMEGRKFRCPRCGGSGYVEDSDGNRLAYGNAGQFIPGARCTRCSGTGQAGIGDTTGVRMHEDKLDVPLHWRKPRKVFVCSMSDLFHEAVSSSFIARVLAVMALTPQHTYQVLTKRPARMRALLSSRSFEQEVGRAVAAIVGDDERREARMLVGEWTWDVIAKSWHAPDWPLPNVWLGVTVEDQERAYLRIPILLDTPAVVRWLSCEPLLGPVNLPVCRCLGVGSIAHGRNWPDTVCDQCGGSGSQIDWVVVGGESGPNARPMHPDWARSLRDQCASAGVPFLFKQWGEWVTESQAPDDITLPATSRLPFGNRHPAVWRVGKKRAGRLLDGIQHDGYPRGAS